MIRIYSIILLLPTIWSLPAHAQDAVERHPFLSAKFALSMGIFYPERGIRLRASGTIEPAPEPEELIDFVEELGISETNARQIKSRAIKTLRKIMLDNDFQI